MTQDSSLTTRERTQQQAFAAVKRVAVIAGSTQRGLSYFLALGVVASLYLIWLAYSADSANWWNAVKALLLVWPSAILGFTWLTLGQIHEAPASMSKLNQDTKTAYQGIKDVKIREPKGIRGMLKVLYQFHREGSLTTIFETVGGIGLLLNPIFLFLVCLSAVVLLMLSFTALLIVLF